MCVSWMPLSSHICLAAFRNAVQRMACLGLSPFTLIGCLFYAFNVRRENMLLKSFWLKNVSGWLRLCTCKVTSEGALEGARKSCFCGWLGRIFFKTCPGNYLTLKMNNDSFGLALFQHFTFSLLLLVWTVKCSAIKWNPSKAGIKGLALWFIREVRVIRVLKRLSLSPSKPRLKRRAGWCSWRRN